MKAPRPTLIEALRGRITKHHRFMLKLHLDQVDALGGAIVAKDGMRGLADGLEWLGA